MQDALDKVQRKKGPLLEGGMVVTDVSNGNVLAVVGDRDVAGLGFNRALDAQRPVGSLLKPFVYLLALAQPGKYSLAKRVDRLDATGANGHLSRMAGTGRHRTTTITAITARSD